MKVDITIHGLADFLNLGAGILRRLDIIQENQEKIMASIKDLDGALDQLGAALTATATAQTKAIADLTAAIAAGQPDVSDELARVSAFTAQVAALGAAASAADPTTAVPAVPVTPTP